MGSRSWSGASAGRRPWKIPASTSTGIRGFAPIRQASGRRRTLRRRTLRRRARPTYAETSRHPRGASLRN
ncbi:hypothetical protein ATSB10_27620 [Dyella thiooxydans]|uniref:Uncharacterized protein n=1 Tax=Dyella thiooxydans TaxID=445710 RepID=A0A160N2S3_9GAMM|nr:hypothetical protein ATSB10_27620 [Dyella thiooxydans]